MSKAEAARYLDDYRDGFLDLDEGDVWALLQCTGDTEPIDWTMKQL